jgi:hypothetical protein
MKTRWVALAAMLALLAGSCSPPGAKVSSAREAPAASTATTSLFVSSAATPKTIDQLVLYTNHEDGYELLLPRAWVESADQWKVSQAGVRRFGFGSGFGTRGSPGLTITLAGTDHIRICPGIACPQPVLVSSLDRLEEVLESTPRSFSDVETAGDLNLGGEPGRFEYAATRNNCLGCPSAFYHAFTFHDGRAIVLAFDFWNWKFQRLENPHSDGFPLEAILESFRFLDEAEESSQWRINCAYRACGTAPGRTGAQISTD